MDWAQILVILLSVLLAVFLLLGVVLLVVLVRISMQIKKVAASASRAIEGIENSVSSTAKIATLKNAFAVIQRVRGKKRGGDHVKK